MTLITATQGDITTFAGDAIVNAANSRLAGGGGVDGAIHRAGGPSILAECSRWVAANGPLPTGEAMVTGGGSLPARFVIHTVGPIWGEHHSDESVRLLASCYRNSLERAVETGSRSVAFPNISTGVYGFPKEPAAETAVSAVRDWAVARSGVEEIVFVCFNDDNRELYSRLLDG